MLGGLATQASRRTQMKLHGNAALSLNKRKLLARRVVEEGWSLTSAAAAAEVSVPTTRKWARRYRAEGQAGLLDRPSAARRVHNRTPQERIGAICALRRLRMNGAELAEGLGVAVTTVSGRPAPRSASSAGRSTPSNPTGSEASGSSPTTAGPIAPPPARSPVGRSASAT